MICHSAVHPRHPPSVNGTGHVHFLEEPSPCFSPSLVSVAFDDMLATRPLQPSPKICPPPGLEHLGSPTLLAAEARPWSAAEPLLPNPPAYRPQVPEQAAAIPPPPRQQPCLQRTVPPPPPLPAPVVLSPETCATPPAPREEPCLRLALSDYLMHGSGAQAACHDDCKPCAFFHTKGCRPACKRIPALMLFLLSSSGCSHYWVDRASDCGHARSCLVHPETRSDRQQLRVLPHLPSRGSLAAASLHRSS